MGAWLFLVFFCVVPLVQAAQPGAPAAASLSLLASAVAVSAAAEMAAAGQAASLLASRKRRDKDSSDSKGAKTINGYVSAFRNF